MVRQDHRRSGRSVRPSIDGCGIEGGERVGNPQTGVVVGSLPYEGLPMLPLAAGCVWSVGGGRAESWLYRH